MSQARAASAQRVLWIGTYESDYPRTRVLVSGLRALGVEVEECHRPLWELTRHKAGGFLSPRRAPATIAKYARAWAGLARDERRIAPVDAVVAGYPAQLDALPARRVARRRRSPLVVDAMISLSDTLTGDRARVGAGPGRALELLDSSAVRRADVVLVDTEEHGRWFTERFGLDPARVHVVPVGAEDDLFAAAPPPQGEVHALFYGKLAPLHGLTTVLAAARHAGAPPVRVVGEGQLGDWLRDELRRDPPPGLTHVPWIPYEELGTAIASASISLGIFGESAKAARVVPNKVFQAMAVGRPIITADTPAIREVLTDDVDALLVPAGDADALGGALARLAGDAELRARLGTAARRRYEEVATPEVVARRFLDALASIPTPGPR